jgi:hypothetical protein
MEICIGRSFKMEYVIFNHWDGDEILTKYSGKRFKVLGKAYKEETGFDGYMWKLKRFGKIIYAYSDEIGIYDN